MLKKYTSVTFLALLSFATVGVSSVMAEDGEPEGGDRKSVLDDNVSDLFTELASLIAGPVVTFLMALAFLVFVWGIIKYFISDADGDKSAAKNLMLWSILGFLLISIIFGIVNFLTRFSQMDDRNITLPTLQQADLEQ